MVVRTAAPNVDNKRRLDGKGDSGRAPVRGTILDTKPPRGWTRARNSGDRGRVGQRYVGAEQESPLS